MKKLILLALTTGMAGLGSAQTPFSYTVDSTSFSALTLEAGKTQVRFADLDQNGHLDIVTIGDHGSPNVNTNQHGISVFFGNGTGSGWTLYQNGNFGYGGCAAGDINNDGKQDLAYSMHHNYSTTDLGNQLIEAALGDGSGKNWTPWDDGLAGNGESYGMFGTDLGDINNDGWLDIASNSFGAGQGIHIYKNNSNGTWSQTYQFGNSNTFRYIQFGDMDGDGNLDFVASNNQGSTFFGNGTGSFTLKKAGLPPLPDANGWPYEDVSLYDIDNDGDDDFIFTYRKASPAQGGVYVYKWNKATQQWDNHSTGLPVVSNDKFLCARAADLDMDGWADLVLTSDLSNDVQIWKGNGGTSWNKVYSYPMTSFTGAEDIAIADIDHSGYPDILVWGSYLGGGPFNPQTQNKIRVFMDSFDPSLMSASLQYPKGNECWQSGSVKFIKWISAVPGNHPSMVKIEYSTAGNNGPWTLIAASAPNNGTYQWNVPAAVVSSNCFIRITATDFNTSASAVAMNTVPFSMGCTSSTTGLQNVVLSGEVNLFPNPVSGSATLELSNYEEAQINIYDMFGNLVMSESVTGRLNQLQMQTLSAGLYVLEAKMTAGTERIRFIVR